MKVKAIKTFLNSSTNQIVRAGESFEADENYAGDLSKRGIIEPAGASTSATATGAVPQPDRTAAMSGAPFVSSKSVGGGLDPESSLSPADRASRSRTVVTPPTQTRR